MTGTNAVNKAVAVLVSLMMVATMFVIAPAAGAQESTGGVAPANGAQTELGRETRTVVTNGRCGANAPVVGAQDVNQDVPFQVNSPTSVLPGTTFTVDFIADPVPIPANLAGLATINNIRDIELLNLVSAGVDVVSVAAVPGTGSYITPGGQTQAIPGNVSVTWNPGTRKVRTLLSGPFTGGSTVAPPTVRATVTATGASGAVVTTQLAGTIPASTSTFPWPDYGFALLANATVAIITADVPTYCSPNYGPRSDILANRPLQTPFLSRTVIDGEGPELRLRSPQNGATYDVDEGPTVDFECVDPSGVVECVMTDENDNVVLPGDKLPDSQARQGELTLRATDGFGFTSERTITYRISGNSRPLVEVGDDIEAATNKRVTLSGSATDPDFGQLLSYTWVQQSGPVVELIDSDDPFATDNTFITPAGPAELVFALRVDDGVGYGEDTVTVFVDPNNAPVITNGQDQVINDIETRGAVTMNATATDADDQPVSYTWTQVDDEGDVLASDDPERVVLSNPNAPVVTFTAPDISDALTLRFQVLVSDGDPRAEVLGTVTVNVEPNGVPVFGKGPAQIVPGPSGSLFTLDGTAVDPEGKPVTYSWTQINAQGDELQVGDSGFVPLSPSTTAPIVTFTAPKTPDPITLRFRVVASDGYALGGDALGTVTVEIAANVAPQIVKGVDQTIDSVQTRGEVTLDGTAIDPEGEPVTYSWTQVNAAGEPLAVDDPTRVTLSATNTATATFTGLNTSTAYSLYFQVTVADGVERGVTVGDIAVNFRANVLPVFTAPTTATAPAGIVVTLDGTATDADIVAGDDQTLVYAWVQVDANGNPLASSDPDFATLVDPTTAKPTFQSQFRPDPYTLYFRVTATDGYDNVTQTITLSMTGNLAPIANAGADQQVARGVVVTLDSSGSSDPDNHDLTGFQWTQVDAGGTPLAGGDPALVSLSSSTAANPTFTAPTTPTTLYFSLLVTDEYGAVSQSADIVAIIVANRPPTADAGADQTAKAANSSVALSGSATDADIPLSLTYKWEQVDANGNLLTPTIDSTDYNVTITNDTSLSASFVTPILSSASTLYFRLTVTDDGALVATDTTSVAVLATTLATPTANSGAGNTAAYNGGVYVQLNIDKPGAPGNPSDNFTYQWIQTNATGSSANCQTADNCPQNFEVVFNTSGTFTGASGQLTASPRQPVILMPGRYDGTPAAWTFRALVTDTTGGATLTSSNLSLTTNNSSLTFRWSVRDAGSPATAATSDSAGSRNGVWRAASAATDQTNSVYELSAALDAAGLETSNPDLDNVSCVWSAWTDARRRNGGLFSADDRASILRTSPDGGTDRTRTTTGRGTCPSVYVSAVDDQARYFRVVVTSSGFTTQTINFAVSNSSRTNTVPTSALTGTTTETVTAGVGQSYPATVALNGQGYDAEAICASGQAGGATNCSWMTNGNTTAGNTNVEQLPSQTVTYEWRQVTAANSTTAVAANDPLKVTINNPTGTLASPASRLTLNTNKAANTTFNSPANNTNGTVYFRLAMSDGIKTVWSSTAREVTFQTNTAVPVANAGPDQDGIRTGATVTLDSSASTDVGGSIVSRLWTQVDSSGNPVTPTVSLTGDGAVSPTFVAPSVTVDTDLYFKVVVTDNLGDTGSDIVRIGVLRDQFPTAVAGGNPVSALAGDTVTLSAAGSADPENLTLSYLWTQVDGDGNPVLPTDPTYVTLTGSTTATATFSAPGLATASSLRFKLSVADPARQTTTAFATINVAANGAPTAVATSLPAKAGDTVTLNGTGSTDPENATLTYAWVQVDANGDPLASSDPAYVTLTGANTASATFSAPGLATPSNLRFRLTVADPFNVTGTALLPVVIPANGAPVAATTATPDPAAAGQTVTLSGANSTDPEGKPLGYAWVQVDANGDPVLVSDPTYVTLTGATSVSATFTAPANALASTLRFRLTVTDQFSLTNAAIESVAINADLPPVASGTATPSAAKPSESVTLSGSGSTDPESKTLTYAWVQVDGNGDPVLVGDPAYVTLTGANTVTATFTAPNRATASNLRFRLTVSDPFLATNSTVVAVSVAANQAPTASAFSAPFAPAAGATVTLDASGSTDPESRTLTFLWAQTDLAGDPLAGGDPALVTLSSTTTASVTFTAPGQDTPPVRYFKVTVSDDINNTSAVIVSVAVQPNKAPVATVANSSLLAPPLATVTLDGSASSDPEGSVLTYQWTQTSGPSVVLTGATTSTATFTAPVTEGDILQFELVVTDIWGKPSAPKMVAIALQANNKPLASAGAAQINRRPGQTVTLDGSGSSDPDGNTFTYAWAQIDSGTLLPVTGGVVLNTATAEKPTFVALAAGQLLFRLVVTDQYGFASNPSFTLVFVEPNRNPVPNAGTDQTQLVADTIATLTGSATDADIDDGADQTLSYLWTQVSGTTVSLTGATTTSATFAVPALAAAEDLVFRLTVTDNYGGSATDDVTIGVRANRNPVVDAGTDQSGRTADAPVNLSGSATDADIDNGANQALSYLWTQVSGTTVSLTGATTTTPSFTAPSTQSAQNLVFRLTVSDGSGGTGTDDVTVGVKANSLPVVNAGADQSGVSANAPVNLSGSATDADIDNGANQALSYLWTQVSGTTVSLTGASTTTPSFTAPSTQSAQNLVFRLTVSDGSGGTGTDDVTVGVKANTPPVSNAGADQTGIQPNTLVTLNGSGSSDADPQTITYSWLQTAGTSVVLSSSTAVGPTFTTPITPSAQTLTFQLTVNDGGGGITTDTVNIGVLANRAPVANAGTDQLGAPGGQLVTLDGSGSSDPDAQNVTYAWTQTAGFPVTLSSTTAAKPTFTAPISVLGASLQFQLVVTDTLGLASAPDRVNVIVSNNVAPVANAGANQNVPRGRTVTLDGTGSSDPNGDALTYQWLQTVGATLNLLSPSDPFFVTLAGSTSANPTFTAPAVTQDTEIFFVLVVTDPSGLASTPAWTKVTLGLNKPPVASAGPDQSDRTANSTVTLTAAGTLDPDAGETFTYEWTQVDADGNAIVATPSVTDAAVELATPTAVTTTFVTPIINASTTLRFKVLVTDSEGESSEAFVNIGVLANRAPYDYRTLTSTRFASTGNRTFPFTGTTNAGLGGTPTAGDRVLMKNQTNTSQNGVWVVAAGSWTRATDADTAADLAYTVVRATAGTGANVDWYLPVGVGDIPTLGTSVLPYTNVAFPALTASGTSSNRTVGTTVTLTMPLPTGTFDPDNTSRNLYTFNWFRTASADSSTPCGQACPGLPATLNNADTRVATFTVPGITIADPTMYFRMAVDDGFGGVTISPSVTVQLTNSPVTINRSNIVVRTGADFSVSRTLSGGPAVNTSNSFQAGNFPATTYVYGGLPVMLDARNAANDPDGGTVNVDFQSGLLPVVTSLISQTSQNPNGVCSGGFLLFETETPNVWKFIPPTNVTQVNAYCRLQFRAADQGGSTTAWGTPAICVNGFLEDIAAAIAGQPACDGSFHTGSRSQGASQRAANVSSNVSADFWLQIVQNQANPIARVEPLPARVFNSSQGAGETLVPVDGSGSSDADSNPVQPLVYKWTNIDPVTLEPQPDPAPADDPLSDRTSPDAEFTAPEGGPSLHRFQLEVTDGIITDVVETTTMKVTTRRPVIAGTVVAPDLAPVSLASARPSGIPNEPVGTYRRGDLVELTGAGSVSPDGRELSYEWRQLSGPDAEIDGAFDQNATVTVGNPVSGQTEDVVIELAIRDGYSAAYKTFTLVNEYTAPEPDVFCPEGSTNPFTDVSYNPQVFDATGCLVEQDVLTAATTFNPFNTLNRGQQLLILHRLEGAPEGYPAVPAGIFTDMPATGQLRKAIEWAYADGIATPAPRYNPGNPVNRQQMVLFLHRLAGEPVAAAPSGFTDLSQSSVEVRDAVAWAVEVGVATGPSGSNTKFNPLSPMQRGQMALFVWRYGHAVAKWNIDPAVLAMPPRLPV